MASEKELLEKQMSLLRESLEARTEELSTLRRQNSSQILQLQADLASKLDQVRRGAAAVCILVLNGA